jgi:basic membrane protein A and related proteins
MGAAAVAAVAVCRTTRGGNSVKYRHRHVALLALVTAGLVLSVALSSATAARSTSTAGLKVAVVLSVGLRDTGYGRSALAGITKIKKDFGIDVATSDLVAPANFATSMSDYASRGFNVVIADGVEFQDAAKQVAAKFPNTKFVVVNGSLAAKPNLTAYNFRWEQAGFLGGIVAGVATKSNKLGNIGGIKIPPIQQLFFGFAQGVKKVNATATTTVSYAGSFTDPAKAKTVALAQISQGIDLIWAVTDTANTGIYQAVKQKRIRAIGYGTDESSFAPKNIITTTLVGYGKVIYQAVAAAKAGTLQPIVYLEGFKQGVFGLAPFRGLLTSAQAAKVNALAKQAEAGKIPIKTMGH